MIQITVPEFDYTLFHNEIHALPKKPGVYILFNDQDKALYVGMTKNLQKRLPEHFSKVSNIFKYRGQFHTVKAFIEEDSLSRRIYEMYLISHYKTELNIIGNDFKIPEDKATSTRCKFIRNNDERCKKKAHTNGYCGLHGGNGISMGKLIQEAIVEYHRKVSESK
jgi:excinuclease UvrABC nuclease subunit